MEEDKNKEPEKEQKNIQNKAEQWLDKAEEFMDDASEKIYKSDAYKKTGHSIEKATINIFRKAGRWWGKSESSVKNIDTKKED